jgi:DNA polymerase III psi subunit
VPAKRSDAFEDESLTASLKEILMSMIWVKAGQCNQEITIEARRSDMTHVAVDFVTTCEHIQKLADVLKSLDIAHEMSTSLLETEVYQLANEYVCRNSCVVPAAILKSLEVEANIFLPAESQFLFLDSTRQTD